MRKIMRRILHDNTGATAIEYGLIAALLVIAMMVALQSFAGSAIGMFTMVESRVNPEAP